MTVLVKVASVPSPYFEETLTFFCTEVNGDGRLRLKTNSFLLIFLLAPLLVL